MEQESAHRWKQTMKYYFKNSQGRIQSVTKITTRIHFQTNSTLTGIEKDYVNTEGQHVNDDHERGQVMETNIFPLLLKKVTVKDKEMPFELRTKPRPLETDWHKAQ
jgi:hypothetical protein